MTIREKIKPEAIKHLQGAVIESIKVLSQWKWIDAKQLAKLCAGGRIGTLESHMVNEICRGMEDEMVGKYTNQDELDL